MSHLTVDRYLNSTIDSEGQVEHDERLDIKTIYTSWSGILITVTSAVISIVASTVVVRLIYRSSKGLKNSVYHRILFGMSAADIVQSIALALTTLPMPKDMIYTNFQGLILGNNATCLTQGFLVSFGAFTGLMYNAMLSLYYLCSIRYYMSNKDFARWIEPLLHGVSVVSGLTIASALASYKSYHPSPTSTSWCGLDSYPYWCTDRACLEGIDIDPSVLGSTVSGALISYLTFGFSLAVFVILVSSMVLIVITVRDQQLRMNKKDSSSNSSTETRTLARQAHILNNTKVVMKQALAYTLINVFGFVMIVVIPIVRNFSRDRDLVPSTTHQIFYLILRPLQGLLNSIIFIYHKASDLQRANPAFKFCTAFGQVLKGEEDQGDGRVVSDLLILRQHSALGRLRMASFGAESSAVDESAEIEEASVDRNDIALDECEKMVTSLEKRPSNSNFEASMAEASQAGSDQNTLSGYSFAWSTAHASSSSGNDLSNNDRSLPSMQLSISNFSNGSTESKHYTQYSANIRDTHESGDFGAVSRMIIQHEGDNL